MPKKTLNNDLPLQFPRIRYPHKRIHPRWFSGESPWFNVLRLLLLLLLLLLQADLQHKPRQVPRIHGPRGSLEAVYCPSWKFPSFKDILPRPSFSSGSLATLKRGADDNFKVLCYIILLRNQYLDDGRNSICLWFLFLLPVVKDYKYGCGFWIESISRPNWPVKVLDTKWTVWYAFKQDQRQNVQRERSKTRCLRPIPKSATPPHSPTLTTKNKNKHLRDLWHFKHTMEMFIRPKMNNSTSIIHVLSSLHKKNTELEK